MTSSNEDIYRRVAQGSLAKAEAMALLKSMRRTKQEASQTTPLSSAQQALWLVHQLAPDNRTYNIPFAFRLAVRFDTDVLARALARLVARHAMLRTVFREQGGAGVQIELPGVDRYFEVRPLPRGDDADLVRSLRIESARPFDLAQGPLLRVVYFRAEEGADVLFFCFHHLVADGVSLTILLQELRQLCARDDAALPDLDATYTEFVRWQQAMLAGAEGERHRHYWQQRLDGMPAPLNLPYDRQRPAAPSYRGATFSSALDPQTGSALGEAIDQLARSRHTSVYTVLLAAFKTLLHRYTQREDIVVGSPAAARPQTRFESVIGYFANVLVLRSTVTKDMAFSDLLVQEQEALLEAMAHADYPFFDLLREVKRTDRSAPLIQASFHFTPMDDGVGGHDPAASPALQLKPIAGLHQEGEFDLTLEVRQEDRQGHLYFKYNPDLFDEATIERLARHYRQVLAEVVRTPDMALSAIDLLTADERAKLLAQWTGERRADPEDTCAFELFEEQARRRPGAVAVLCDGRQLTYAELQSRSAQLAAHLHDQGVGLGSVVGVFMPRSVDMMVALLAVQKSGAAYVPFDPSYPPERLTHVLDEGGIALILSQSVLLDQLSALTNVPVICLDRDRDAIAAAPAPAQLPKPGPHDLVYIIFTSGSTGRPKGVQITHRSLANLLCSMRSTPGFGESDHILSLASVSFDMIVPELYLPLVCGGKVELVTTDVARDGMRLARLIDDGHATIVPATPSTWRMLLAADWKNPRRVTLFCGGEALTPELAVELLARTDSLWNQFGPTETTVWSSMCQVRSGQGIHIGHPIANTTFRVLDADLKLLPVGWAGELHIGGHGLARGYLARPELTREKFIADPFDDAPGARLYKTGDLVRQLPDGTLSYLGRIDQQVKIRGHRIELGELESALKRSPAVGNAIVALRHEGAGRQVLTGFLQPSEPGVEIDLPALRESLLRSLPDYMVPARFVTLASFPMTVTRKIDRGLLASAPLEELQADHGLPAAVPREAGDASRRAAHPLEDRVMREVLALATEVLEMQSGTLAAESRLGEFGFDSIHFTMLSKRIENAFGVQVQPPVFYDRGTVRAIAAYMLEQAGDTLARRFASSNDQPAELPRPIEAPAAQARPAVRPARAEANEPVAIIGFSGRFPQSADAQELWRHLWAGTDLITEIPPQRWPSDLYYGDPAEPNKSNSKWGGFIDGVDRFDAAFFGISPREAEMMDPQQRLFLETVWKTFEHAGYAPSSVAGSRTGVFVGVTAFDYLEMMLSDGHEVEPHTVPGVAHTVIPNRVSFFFDLKGPSTIIDTACSSSLVACHRAVTSLQRGECSMAIAGGVNLILRPYGHIALSKSGMMSPDGRCKTFDSSANGYVRGEGVAAVLLKPLSQAEADGDYIHGVILGSAENHGGRTHSLTAPGAAGQAELLVQAYRRANVDPSTLTYIETHGTGTSLGDPIEVNGLKSAFSQLCPDAAGQPGRAPWIGLGAIKSNLGHLEAAAGIAGLFKVLLAMQHRRLPANLHLREPNPYVALDGSPFYLMNEGRPWHTGQDDESRAWPRRAGVSAFGFGGSNAHLILEEADTGRAMQELAAPEPVVPRIFVLSARDGDRLAAQALQLADFLREHDEVSLTDVAHTLRSGREAMAARVAVVASDRTGLIDKLAAFGRGVDIDEGVFHGTPDDADDLSSLLAGGAAAAYLGALVQERDFARLARLWVRGVAIDWRLLASGGRRVPLPTYPFAGKRHWLERAKEDDAPAGQTLHPFVDAVVSNDPQAGRFVCSKVFRRADTIFQDHQVRGEPILPGVAYLEMARAAFALVAGPQAFHLERVVWLQPLRMEGESAAVRIVFQREHDGGHAFEIRDEAGQAPRLYTKGEIRPGLPGAMAMSAHASTEIAEIEARCPDLIDRESLYGKFERLGIQFGPSFRTLQRIRGNGQEALGYLKLPESQATAAAQFPFHPSLLDAALQTKQGLASEQEGLLLPFAVDRVVFHRPLTPSGHAHAVATGSDRADVTLLDAQGRVCVQMQGVVAREAADPLAGCCFVPRWVTSPLPEVPARTSSAPSPRAVLIVASPQAGELAGALRRRHQDDQVWHVRLGATLHQDGPREWEVATADLSHIDAVLRDMPTPHAMYFLGGIHEPIELADPLRLEIGERRRQEGVFSLLRWFKAIDQRGAFDHGFELKVLSAHAQALDDAPVGNPDAAALFGFTQSLAREYPQVSVSCIDLDPSGLDGAALDALARAVRAEPAHTEGKAVAMRRGRRYIQQLVPARLSPDGQVPLRREGVYLILGGAGGIGHALAKDLARSHQARLILVGRTAQPEGLPERLAEIERLGGQARYLCADATCVDSMAAAVAQARSAFGRIHGVFHSALVLQDRALKFMDEATLQAALAPKVEGSIVLHHVLRDEPLDFMVFFSSAQSFKGAPGQGNYAAACTFKDSFARYLDARVPYPVKTMHWGYWGSVGVVSDAQTRQRMSEAGFQSIEPPEGMEAIRRLLANPLPQLVFLKAAQHVLVDLGVAQPVGDSQSQDVPAPVTTLLATIQPQREQTDSLRRIQAAHAAVEAICHRLLVNAFQRMGVFLRAGEHHHAATFRERLAVEPAFDRLFEALIDMLVRSGYVERRGDLLVASDNVGTANTSTLALDRERLAGEHPESAPHLRLVWACLEAYPLVLTGQRSAVETIFPGGSKSLVEAVYRGSELTDSYHRLVAQLVQAYVAQRLQASPSCTLDILEVGAGTGGTSAFVLEAIADLGAQVRYHYTDVSLDFTRLGEEKFGAKFPFTAFRVMDLEQDPLLQGFEAGSMDLILGSNVVHATRNIATSARYLQSLIKDQGVLVLNEMTRTQDFATLTFGLTKGWWAYDDEAVRLPGSPLLGRQAWQAQLEAQGFGAVNGLGFADPAQAVLGQHVIVAQNAPAARRHAALPSNAPMRARAHAADPARERPLAADEPSLVATPTSADIRDFSIDYLRRLFARTLKLDASELDVRASFSAYGVDSLIVMELMKHMERDLGKLPTTMLFEHTTIDGVATYLRETRSEALARLRPVQRQPQGEPPPAAQVPQSRQENTPTPRPDSSAQHDAIAVIGMSGRFPMAQDLAAFWDQLRNGKEGIGALPATRREWTHASPRPHGGFLSEVDAFDPLFFGISPREAEAMDPQERLFLEVCWELLEDAGYALSELTRRGPDVGVFAGVMYDTYGRIGAVARAAGLVTQAQSHHASVANRISFHFDFRGPSLALDSACSSSLSALHLACESLRRGECHTAIVGGVNLILHPMHLDALKSAEMLSPTGRNSSFSAAADGFVPGEAVAAVLLKPLEAALADGDRIDGLILATHVNAGGKTAGFTVPNPNAQAELIQATLAKAGVPARSVSYVEAHGTGTVLGDPIEVRGLTKAFAAEGVGANEKQFCAIGSLKSNIGHTEAAAGISGLIKVLMQMRHRQLVPSLHAETLNPAIEFETTPFFVQQDAASWRRPVYQAVGETQVREHPRRAGVSSFGAGGANAHVIVEEFEAPPRRENPPTGPGLFVLSAKTRTALADYAGRMAKFVREGRAPGEPADEGLAELCHASQVGREPMKERLAIVAASRDELADLLDALARDADAAGSDPRCRRGTVKSGAVALGHGERDDEAVRGAAIVAAMEGHDLAALATLWVAGVPIPWRKLHVGKPPARATLPTYPFERHRYWAPVAEVPGTPTDAKLNSGSVRFSRPEWTPAKGPTPDARATEAWALLVFANAGSAEERVLRQLSAQAGMSTPLIVIQPGADFRQQDASHFELDPTVPRHHERLVEVLQAAGTPPLRVLHLWLIEPTLCRAHDALLQDHAPAGDAVAKSFEAALDSGARALFEFSKAVAARAPDSVRKIVSIWRAGKEAPHPAAAAWAGLARSASVALPATRFSTVETDAATDDLDAMLTQALVELRREPDENERGVVEVRFERGDTLLKTLREWTPPAQRSGLRERGTYVITGGLGGLGFQFARHLTLACRASVALIGQSALDPGKQQQLQALEALGGQALYVQADVADRTSLAAAFARVRERFGDIHGVIHAAGRAWYESFAEKRWSALRAVMAPKVDGVRLVDELTRGDSLDFFAVFSSTASLFGDFGQGDYAAANRFLDAYGEWRTGLVQRGLARGRTLVINWPLWREGGMHGNRDAEALHLRTSGTRYLEIDAGLQAFETALASSEGQVIVAVPASSPVADPPSWRDTAGESAPAAQSRGSVAVDAPALVAHVQARLQEIVADLLKIDHARVDPDDNLGDFGFDSLTLKAFADLIGSTYGLSISPTVFYAHPCLSAIALHLATTHPMALQAVHERGSPAALSEERTTGAGGDAAGVQPLVASPATDEGAECEANLNDLAIVGAAGILPGSPDLDAFWTHLANDRDLITRIPAARWDWQAHGADDAVDGQEDATSWGGFIPDMERFDAEFFHMSPLEAELTDPQQRLFLETAWKAVEDASMRACDLSGKAVGVFVGVQSGEYQQILGERVPLQAQMATGNATTMLPNRLSYLLNLRGPSETVDTACSSSLVALHRAIRSIRSGESELAIVGAVSLILSPHTMRVAQKLGVLSPEGRCKTFDRDASGYVKGEGVGVVVVQSLRQALAEGRPIHAVIKGSAVGHGGKANSLTAPNSRSQADLLQRAWQDAGVTPDTLSYIEAHGTGTALGDPVEVEGLMLAFRASSTSDGQAVLPRCALGSVKANIGHLEPAAGMAGLLKVILAMRHRTLPGTPHLRTLNPLIQLDDSPFEVLTHARPWQPSHDGRGRELPLRAGISSFGFGGANAHVVLEAPAPVTRRSVSDDGSPHVIVLSAHKPAILKQMAARLIACLERSLTYELADIAHTLQAGRDAMPVRLAVVAASLPELSRKLGAFVAGASVAGVHEGTVRRVAPKRGEASSTGGHTLVDDAIAGRRLDDLAGLWVTGQEINWHALHPDARPRLLRLPTYPFAGGRYPLPPERPKAAGDLAREPHPVQTAARCAFYHPTWAMTSSSGTSPDSATDRVSSPILLFADEAAKGDVLRLKSAAAIVWVRPGDTFDEGDGGTYAVNPARADDFTRLWACLDRRGQLPSRVMFVAASSAFEATSTVLHGQLERDVHPFFCLMQTLLKVRSRQVVRVLYVYKQHAAGDAPVQGAVGGLAKVLAMESSTIRCKTVGVSGDAADAGLPGNLLNEFDVDDDAAVWYRDGVRWQQGIERIDPVARHGASLREGGVYVITGGLGGLGRHFARHLARTAKAKLVLSGRSPLNEHARAFIDDLQAMGAQACYVSADVSREEDASRLVAQARARFGAVHGILHAAGIHRDGLLVDKTRSEIDAVLSVKVGGTVHLDKATASDALDFFCLFSSLAASVGNPGQTDYAYANSFMDAFALWRHAQVAEGRRFGTSCSINWPLWLDGGARVDDGVDGGLFERAGMQPLPTADGLAAWRALVLSGSPSTSVAYGDPVRIDAFLAGTRHGASRSQAEAEQGADQTAAPPGQRLHEEDWQHFLKNLIAQTLKTPVDDIDAWADFETYGIDSIAIVQLNARLSEHAVDLPKTLFFEYPNLDELARHLAERHGALRREPVGREGTATPAATMASSDAPDRSNSERLQQLLDEVQAGRLTALEATSLADI